MKKLLALCACAAAGSATADDWFPFGIDFLAGAPPAFDLSTLNEKPAGTAGWLRVEGERLVDARGRTVRLLGVNLTARACFPAPDESAPLARALARYGVNVVRLHFLDNEWGGDRLSLVPKSNDLLRDGLETNALARLDIFVAALRAEGVLVNINLHVGRSYPGDPRLTSNSKGIGNFMPDMIAELKTYSRLLLTHVNPHTGLAYKDDPAIPVLEISNEDSLALNPWWIERLEGAPAAELRRQFNDWLRATYRDTAGLRAAWGVDTGYTGPDLLPAGGLPAWNLEQHGGSRHEVVAQADGTVRWTGLQTGSESWHMQLSSGRIELKPGTRYEVLLKARAPAPAPLAVNASQSGSPWGNVGLYADFTVEPEWREFRFLFDANDQIGEAGARLTLSLKNQANTVEVAALHCRPVSGGYLKPDQTLEAGIPLPRSDAPPRVRRDLFQFLAGVEIAFASEIKRYLREELGCRALISHSQVQFGGPLGARRELAVSDFVDIHGYWHHPHFPRKPWDAGDWEIVNESQIRSWDGGTLAELAMLRPAGKPYAVSEYDIPAPNDHAAETWPMFAAMAGFQDWCALYHYTLGHGADDVKARHITGYFNLAGHPAKLGLMPAGALMFRLGLVAPARERVALNLGDDAIFDLATECNGGLWGTWRPLWDRRAKQNGSLALRHGTVLALTGPGGATGPAKPMPAAAQPPYRSDTGEWTWDTTNGVFVLGAPAARVWSGELGGRRLAAGDAELETEALDRPAPSATVVLVALDGKPVAESARLLVTALRRAENEGMVFDEKRKTVGRNWGHPPVRVLGLRATLRLPGGARWSAQPLDEAGQPRGPAGPPGRELIIRPDEHTIWWVLTRV